MTGIRRTFLKTYPKPERGEDNFTKEIDQFFEHQILIILGAPGLGKTTVFTQAADVETNAQFIRIGEFLATDDVTDFENKILYLDGLDEQRSKSGGKSVMDALVAKIKQAKPIKVRISCRVAEWLGENDLHLLKHIFPQSDVIQLNLQPLSENDIQSLLKYLDSNINLNDFTQGAYKHDLVEFLQNPGDLILLHQFYNSAQKWPETRAELMEGACFSLIQETNRVHYDEKDDQLTDFELVHYSEYLSAVMLLSGVEGLALTRLEANRSFPPIHKLAGDMFRLKVAASRRVYSQVENQRISARHRKISEYMAARYLARRVREGMSLRRLMTLLTGFDGTTAPELRGVYAWLVTLLAGVAEHVLHHDPYGAVVYGDTYSWSPNTKRKALCLLKNLALKDPWFRHNDRSVKELAGLIDESLIPEIIKIVSEDDGQSHLLGVIFDALSEADTKRNHKLENALINFIKDESKPDHYREDAIQALCGVLKGDLNSLKLILGELNTGNIKDERQYLRGALFEKLYPEYVKPNEIVDYLIEPAPNFIGSYYMFLLHKIVQKTPIGELQALASSAKTWASQNKLGRYQHQFMNSLSVELIKKFYNSAEIKDIYSWLCFNINKHGSSVLNSDKKSELAEVMSKDPRKQFYIFKFVYQIERRSENVNSIFRKFKELVSYSVDNSIFVANLYQDLKYSKELDFDLFKLLCYCFFHVTEGCGVLTIEEMESLASKRPELHSCFEKEKFCSLENIRWRQEHYIGEKRAAISERQRVDQNKFEFEKKRKSIECGRATEHLIYYAKIWLGHFIDIDKNITPRERLNHEIGDGNAEIAILGFRESLKFNIFKNVEEIAKLDLENKYFEISFLMDAALQVISSMDGREAILELPSGILKLAVCYYLAKISTTSNVINWIREAKPELYADTVEEFWRVQLQARPEITELPRLYEMEENHANLSFFSSAALRILNDGIKLSPKLLSTMLSVILKSIDKNTLIPLVDRALKSRHKKIEFTKALWLAVGFRCNADLYYDKVKSEIFKNSESKWVFRKFLLSSIDEKEENGRYKLPAIYRFKVCKILLSCFDNISEKISGSIRVIAERSDTEVARQLRAAIYTFSDDTSDDAVRYLEQLRGDKSLDNWRWEINYASANQLRALREARFTYPNVDQVVRTLSNSEPANSSDLKALIIDTLTEISEDIRHGNTDPYKQFWNIDCQGKPTTVHVDENTARDRLLDLIRLKLKHLDIVAEPEARYADDKRADIAIYYKSMKLPIEIKRDDHREIWTAARNQLKERYTRDPGSEGNGIYLLFWFDGKQMVRPPDGIRKPSCALSLKEAISQVIPESAMGLIEPIVIDAAVPTEKQSGLGSRKVKV